ncbi:MAG: GNAT family N-acetyltransferase [Alphaproteobacteria bacterium]|nr:GNAT family N-acetyltransferase [Alphaproteobacteria bacterium]
MHDPPYPIRPFADIDLERIRALIHRTIDRSYGAVYPPRALPFFKRFHDAETIRTRASSGLVLVLEEDGRPTGTGALVEGEILGVFVDPDRQGGGRGRALMRALEGEAVRQGRDACTLSISLPSRRFYERLGYRTLDERTRDLGDGQVLRFWKGVKRLTPTDAAP